MKKTKHKSPQFPQVEVINVKEDESTPIKGSKYFAQPSLYPKNVSVVAPTSSGKTQLVQTALFRTINKQTEAVFLFCSTSSSDPLWVEICKRIQKITKLVVFDGFKDDKVNNLDAVTRIMSERVSAIRRGKDEDEKPGPSDPPRIVFNGRPLPETKQKPATEVKPKVRVPRFVVIADDLSAADLRSKDLYTALKHARHHQAQYYLISQSLVSTLPMSVSQLQWVCIGGGFSSKQLRGLYDKFQFGVDFDVLDALYWLVTKTKYQFLCIDLRRNKLYLNWTPISPSVIPEN